MLGARGLALALDIIELCAEQATQKRRDPQTPERRGSCFLQNPAQNAGRTQLQPMLLPQFKHLSSGASLPPR